jgi:alkylation response protein AidB-like acyl-CoA dehydrogenase
MQLLRDSAARFAAENSSGNRLRARRDQRIEFDAGVWKQMAESGFLAAAIPEEYSGLDLSFENRAAFAEEFGGALLPEPYLTSAVFAATLLASSRNTALQQRLLPAMAAGELVAAVAWEERTDSIVNGAVDTQATWSTRGITLRGRKRFIRPGSMFDGLIVSAAAEGQLGLYWVPAETPGLEFKPQMLADGGSIADVMLNDVRVAPGAVVQAGAMAAEALTSAIDETLVVLSAELLGLLRKALQITLDYLRIRQQFGRPIGSFQALQHRAVNLYIQQELSAVAIHDALAALRGAEPRERSRAASRAKARCSDAALLVTREAVQMHGAIGFTDEHDIGLYLKRALVQSAWLGNAAQHRRRHVALGARSMRRA